MQTRRDVLGIAMAAAGGASAQQTGPAPDESRGTQPSESDSGSVYPLIEKLAGTGNFTHSFLSERFRNVGDYRREGRRLLLDAFGYRPPAVAPQAQVVHRQELPEFTREKIVLSTSPEFRVP